MMPQRPNNPYATGRTPTGAPIMTLEDQKRKQAEDEAAYQAALAAQAQQNQPQADAGAGAPPFPGTAPQMESPGLLAQAFEYLQNNLGGQLRGGVAPENNPLAAGPGEGIGGRRRREEIDEVVEGKKPARR